MEQKLKVLSDIYHKTVEVRSLQKQYFKNRDRAVLSRSKRAEAELDAMLTMAGEVPGNHVQQTLF